MTDFTAGTDLCFTKSTLSSPHLLLFCVCTLGSYPELVSLQTAPVNAGTSPLPSAALVTLLLPKAALTVPEAPRDRALCCCGLHRARGHPGHPVPLASSLPGVYTPRFSSCIYCLPEWEVLDPEPSPLLLTEEPSSGGSSAQSPHVPSAILPPHTQWVVLSHSSSLCCGRASPQPQALPLHCQHHRNSSQRGI